MIGLVGDFDDARDDAVHELAIVARHDERAFEVLEPFFEPDDGFEVEVVGRLVHQQDVGIEREDLGERDPHLPAAAEALDRAVVVAGADAQAGEDFLGARVEVVASALFKLELGFAVSFEKRRPSSSSEIGLMARVFEPLFHLCDFAGEIGDLAGAGFDFFERRAAVHIAHILGEVADDESCRRC